MRTLMLQIRRAVVALIVVGSQAALATPAAWPSGSISRSCLPSDGPALEIVTRSHTSQLRLVAIAAIPETSATWRIATVELPGNANAYICRIKGSGFDGCLFGKAGRIDVRRIDAEQFDVRFRGTFVGDGDKTPETEQSGQFTVKLGHGRVGCG